MEARQPEVPTLMVPPEATSIRTARQFVTATIGADSVRTPELEVLTGELVANAVAHAVGGVKVQVHTDNGRTRVEVHDDNPDPPLLQAPTPDLDAGRGLAIVEALADDWGYWPIEGNGKVVWFELGLEVDEIDLEVTW